MVWLQTSVDDENGKRSRSAHAKALRLKSDSIEPRRAQRTLEAVSKPRGLAHFAESSEQNVPVPFSDAVLKLLLSNTTAFNKLV
jgi:hypothetical protein